MKENVEGRSCCREYFSKALQISEAVGRHRSFEQNIACNYQFTADAGTVGERDSDVVFVEIVFGGRQISPFARSVTGETITNWDNQHRLRWENSDGWTNKVADFVWCHFGDDIELIGS